MLNMCAAPMPSCPGSLKTYENDDVFEAAVYGDLDCDVGRCAICCCANRKRELASHCFGRWLRNHDAINDRAVCADCFNLHLCCFDLHQEERMCHIIAHGC